MLVDTQFMKQAYRTTSVARFTRVICFFDTKVLNNTHLPVLKA